MSQAKTDTYVALLRGINVGGHKKVPMAELRKTFREMGYGNVRTLLASGNVIFDAEEENTDDLGEAISAALLDRFGFPVPVIVRPFSAITEIIAANPFEGTETTPDIRLYVTFLAGAVPAAFAAPYAAPDGSFRIIHILDNNVFSVLDLSISGTPDAMNILEKTFGKDITTRNWNTVWKIGRQ